MGDAEEIRAFHQAMLDLYRRRIETSPLLGYTAGPLGLEIRELGGLEAAKRQIHSEELGPGFVALSVMEHLHLTLEALILDDLRWHALFSEEELAICGERLRKSGYRAAERQLQAETSLGASAARLA